MLGSEGRDFPAGRILPEALLRRQSVYRDPALLQRVLPLLAQG
jgi:hypothetical protein